MTSLGTNSGRYASKLWKGRSQRDVLSHTERNAQVLTERGSVRSWYDKCPKLVQRGSRHDWFAMSLLSRQPR